MMAEPCLRTCELCGESEVDATILDYVVLYNAMNLQGGRSTGHLAHGHLVTVTQCTKCWQGFVSELAECARGGARAENLPRATTGDTPGEGSDKAQRILSVGSEHTRSKGQVP